jgi:pentatricopeptide repeat protein
VTVALLFRPLKDTLKAELQAEANYGAIRPFTEVDWQLIDLAFSSSNMPVLPSQIIAAVDTRAANTTSPKASVSGVHIDVAATADSRDNKQFDVRAARACFLHMFVSLLQGFQQHLKHPSQNNDDNDPNGFGNRSSLAEFFEFQAFTDASSRKHRDYLIGLQQTQAFSKFVEDNLFPSTTQRKDELDFFFGCCAYEDSLLAHKTRTSSTPGLFSMFSSSKAPPPVSNLPSLVSHVTRRRCARDIYSVPPPQAVSSASSSQGFYYSEFPVLDLAQFPTPRPISFDRVADVDPTRVALVRSEFNAAYGKQQSNGLTRSGGSGLLNGSVSGRWSDPRAWASNLLFQVYALWFDVSETILLSSNAVASALPQSTPSLSLTTSFSASGEIVEVSPQANGDTVSSPLSDKSDTEVFAPPTSFTARRARSASVPYRPPAALQLSLITSGIPEEKSRADEDIRHSPAPPPLSARPWSPSNMFASPMVPPSPSSRASFSFAPPPQFRNADSTHSVERGLYLMFSVLRHMFVASVTPDEEVFRAILLVCGRHRKGGEAKEVLTAMRRSGFKPSQATYNAYAAAVAQAGGSSVSSVPLLFENSTPQSSINDVDYDATAAAPAEKLDVAAPALTFKIDWSQLCMGVGQKCPDCSAVLFEEDLMAMWRDEESSQSSSESMLLSPRRQQQPALAAGHFLCPACDLASIQPRLHVRLTVTSKCGDIEPCPPFVEDESATPANETVRSFSVTYMSPIKLRQRLKSHCDQSAAEASVSAANTWLTSVISKLPERLSQSVDQMSEDETAVFNLLWYWANASLPLEFLTLPAEITVGIHFVKFIFRFVQVHHS